MWVALGGTEREKLLCVNQEIEDIILVTREFSLKSVRVSSATRGETGLDWWSKEQ